MDLTVHPETYKTKVQDLTLSNALLKSMANKRTSLHLGSSK